MEEEIKINLDDFKSMKLEISIENVTTHTSVFHDRKIYPKGKDNIVQAGVFPIELCELTDEGLILELPPKCCSKGHMVKLTIETENKIPDEYFVFNMKVDDLKDEKGIPIEKRSRAADARQIFEFKVTDDDVPKFKRFLKLFDRNQNDALDLFEALRGR